MRENIPCLPLIIERHYNAVRATGEKYQYADLDMYMFPQTWGSTALGFGGIGGQTITTAQTVVVEDYKNGWYSVFFDEGLAYLLKNPNHHFFEDLKKWRMKSVGEHWTYKRVDDD